MNTKNIYHIYKIECKQDNTLFYIGITSDYIHRIQIHKSCCNGKNNLKVYKLIRENGGSDNFNFFIIDTFYCIKQIAYDIEANFIYKLKPPMNSNIPYNERIINLDDYKISSYQLRNKNLYNNETNNESNKDDILDRLYNERQILYNNETNNNPNNIYELNKKERRKQQVRLAQRRFMERKRLNKDILINEIINETNNETNNESNNESNNETNNYDKLHETLKTINNNIILLQNILNKKPFLHKRKKYINIIWWK